jgi:hypothetical protein
MTHEMPNPEASQVRCTMMNGMTSGMMWGMGACLVAGHHCLDPAAAALVKYLRSGSKGDRP